jgi:predicted DNA-binding transcriptional regulator AlpA
MLSFAHHDLIDEPAACRAIGGENSPIHRSTLWRGVNAGRYPKPIKVGPGTNRWRLSELLAFINRAAEARASEAA